MQRNISCDPGVTPEQLIQALGEDSVEATGTITHLRIRYLDTFDWRVHSAGARLWEERHRNERVLRWLPSPDQQPLELQIEGTVRFAGDLGPGWLRDALSPLLEMRALLPVGEAQAERVLLRRVDPDGNTTARVWWQAAVPLDAAGNPAGDRFVSILVEGLTGHDRAYSDVVDRLLDLPGAAVDTTGDLERAVSCRGRQPGDYSSKLRLRLEPEQRSDEALTTILMDLLVTLRNNVEGVIEDLDSEFLHDLRVACRRTRSALTQLKGVLPGQLLRPFAQEFKWLGTLTGPCRDLDVYLLEMDTYRAMLPADVARELGPLEEAIAAARARAHRDVADGLRSRRFSGLIETWDHFLHEDHDDSASTSAARAIKELADERILKAYRRIVKHGRMLGDDPPAEPLHRLRIDAKKLRYLLEFFRSLYPARRIDRLIKELKQLQDILGGFNDMEVQQGRLTVLAQELLSAGAGNAGTYLALGRLAVALEARQEDYRHHFHEGFTSFANDASRELYGRLFGASRRSQR